MTSFTWQRAVLKIGSALISPDGQGTSARYLLAIAKFITDSRAQGKEIIVVSSGSVAAGRKAIKSGQKPTIAEKQAMAAIGQTSMMANWARFFDSPCAQILLTVDDLNDRARYVNIKNTLRELLANNAIPIVNENDTVAVDELKVGDNDNLGAHVALVAQADTLIICTDVAGLYDQDPRVNQQAKLIPYVDLIDQNIKALAGDARSSVGTGGMITKLQAAEKCTASGIQTLLIDGHDASVFDALANNICQGTLFSAQPSKHSARRQWLSHTAKIKGQIEIDAGAYAALTKQGASLLPAGIVKVSGSFTNNDVVNICFDGQTIGKGICLYSRNELSLISGKNSHEINHVLGFSYGEEAIHRDHLVLI